MPRPRFAIRRMMIAVGIVAVTLGIFAERRARFRRIAAAHRAEGDAVGVGPFAHVGYKALRAQFNWSLARKYEYAANHPWLPVAPDPPVPKQQIHSDAPLHTEGVLLR